MESTCDSRWQAQRVTAYLSRDRVKLMQRRMA